MWIWLVSWKTCKDPLRTLDLSSPPQMHCCWCWAPPWENWWIGDCSSYNCTSPVTIKVLTHIDNNKCLQCNGHYHDNALFSVRSKGQELQFVHILPSTLVALSWIPKSSSPTVSKLTTPISSSNCLFFPHRTFSLELTHPTRNLILQCSALLTVEPTKFPCLSQFICWVSEMQQMKEQDM